MNTDTRPTVPCGLCEAPTPMLSTKRCDRCWELEMRIKRDRTLALRILAPTFTDILTAGERATLSRALRIYAAKYQELAGREKIPVHKENLRQYVAAADRLLAQLEPHIQHPTVPPAICACAHTSIDEPGAEFCPVHEDHK